MTERTGPPTTANETTSAVDHALAARAPRRRTRVGVGIALVAVTLSVVGAIAAVPILNQGRAPEAVAERYFTAIASGDAATARGLIAENGGKDAEFLTDEVLAAATERIRDVSVIPADDPFDTFGQKVEASYTLAGERHTLTLVLTRGEPEWGVLDTWRIRPASVPTATFDVEGDGRFAIAGVPVDHPRPTVRLFPAVYPVTALDSSYLTLEPDNVVVADPDPRPSVTFVPTPELESEVQAQVNAMVDECAASTVISYPLSSEADPTCPLQVVLSQGGRAEGTWEIIEYPTVELLMGGRLYTTADGRAVFTPDGGDPVEMIRGIELVGDVEVSAEGVRLIPAGTS